MLARVQRLFVGRWLLIIALSISILQFVVQMQYVSHGWSAKWPYLWDENRYFDYACYYRALYERDGLSGLLAAYHQRPAYSFTLLATSLPFLALSRGQEILYWHMLVYVLVFDVAAARIVFNVTRSTRLSALAILAAHFTTYGVFGGSSMFTTAEAVRYQVNFPVAVCVVASLAGLVEGAFARRGWQIASALFLSSICGLLLRGGAMPFFFVLMLLPGAILTCGLFRFRERRLAWSALAGLALSCSIALVHYASIYHLLVNYVRSTVSSPRWTTGSRWDTIWYYLEGAHRGSWAFVLCLAAIALFTFGRIGTMPFGRLALRVDRWSRFRVLFIVATVTWYLVLCYAVPTLMRTKVSGSLLAFMFLVLVAGVACFGGGARRIIGLNGGSRKSRKCGAGAALFLATALSLSMACVVREYGAFRMVSRTVTIEPLEYTARRNACERVVEFIEEWALKESRDFVSFGVPVSIDCPNFADVAVWQMRRGRTPLRVAEIRVDDGLAAEPDPHVTKPNYMGPEIVFIPAGTESASKLIRALEPGDATLVNYKGLGRFLERQHYHKTSLLKVSGELSWEVYERERKDQEFLGFNFP